MNIVDKLTLVFLMLANMIVKLGFFKTVYWCCWIIKGKIVEYVSWPQPGVTQIGDFFIVSFYLKGTRCKIICRKNPYIVDIMKTEEISVKDTFYPFFYCVPINPLTYNSGEKLLLSFLGNEDQVLAHLPPGINN